MKHDITPELLEALSEWKTFLPRAILEGRVGKCDELTISIRSKERGHNTPHVHASTSCASLSISIIDGQVLSQSGKISSKKIQKASEWVLANKPFLTKEWNRIADSTFKFPL